MEQLVEDQDLLKLHRSSLEHTYFQRHVGLKPLFDAMTSPNAKAVLGLWLHKRSLISDTGFLINLARTPRVSWSYRQSLLSAASGSANQDSDYLKAIGLAIEAKKYDQAAHIARSFGTGADIYLNILKSAAVDPLNTNYAGARRYTTEDKRQVRCCQILIARYYDTIGDHKKAAKYLKKANYFQHYDLLTKDFSAKTVKKLGRTEFEVWRDQYQAALRRAATAGGFVNGMGCAARVERLKAEADDKHKYYASKGEVLEAFRYLSLVDINGAIVFAKEALENSYLSKKQHKFLRRAGTKLLKKKIHRGFKDCSVDQIKGLLDDCRAFKGKNAITSYLTKVGLHPVEFYLAVEQAEYDQALLALENFLDSKQLRYSLIFDQVDLNLSNCIEFAKFHKRYDLAKKLELVSGSFEKLDWEGCSVNDEIEFINSMSLINRKQSAYVFNLFWKSLEAGDIETFNSLLENRKLMSAASGFIVPLQMINKKLRSEQINFKGMENTLLQGFTELDSEVFGYLEDIYFVGSSKDSAINRPGCLDGNPVIDRYIDAIKSGIVRQGWSFSSTSRRYHSAILYSCLLLELDQPQLVYRFLEEQGLYYAAKILAEAHEDQEQVDKYSLILKLGKLGNI